MLEERLVSMKKDSKDKLPDKYSIQFTRREIREYSGWAHMRIKRYIDQLVDMEMLTAEAGRFGAAYRYRLIFDVKTLPALITTLPAPYHPGKQTQVSENKHDR